MIDYIVKLLPVKDPIYLGDWITDGKYNHRTKCDSIDYQTKKLTTTAFHGEQDMHKWKKLSFFLCTQKNIKEGDNVVVEYTDGYKPTGEFDIGKLTHIWNEDEGPYCCIDGKSIDLANEGHSSNVYKKICAIEETWIMDGMELNTEDVTFTSEWEGKRCKCLEPGDVVETDIKDIYPTEGTIKSIKKKYSDAYDWEDVLELTDVKKVKYPFDDFDIKNLLYESLPDRTILLGEVRGKLYHVIYCEIKCPTCKHFH